MKMQSQTSIWTNIIYLEIQRVLDEALPVRSGGPEANKDSTGCCLLSTLWPVTGKMLEWHAMWSRKGDGCSLTDTRQTIRRAVLKREAHIIHSLTSPQVGHLGLCEQEGVPCHLGGWGVSTWGLGGVTQASSQLGRSGMMGRPEAAWGDGGWAGPHCWWPPANTGGLC